MRTRVAAVDEQAGQGHLRVEVQLSGSLRADLGHLARAQRLLVGGPEPGHFGAGLADGDAQRAVLGQPRGERVDVEVGAVGKDIQAQIVPASACTIMGVRPDASASSRPTACRCAASSLGADPGNRRDMAAAQRQAQYLLGHGRREPLGSEHRPHLRGAGGVRAFLPALTFDLVDLGADVRFGRSW